MSASVGIPIKYTSEIRITWSPIFPLNDTAEQDLPKGTGIYEIGTMVMDKETYDFVFEPLYVGSTKNIDRRLREHKGSKGHNKHVDHHAKYGGYAHLLYARYFSCDRYSDIEGELQRIYGIGKNGRYLFNEVGGGGKEKKRTREQQSSEQQQVHEQNNEPDAQVPQPKKAKVISPLQLVHDFVNIRMKFTGNPWDKIRTDVLFEKFKEYYKAVTGFEEVPYNASIFSRHVHQHIKQKYKDQVDEEARFIVPVGGGYSGYVYFKLV